MDNKPKLWLYPNKFQTNPNHPVKTGTGEFSRQSLKDLVEALKKAPGDELKVRCAAWERTSKKGNPYTFITIELEQEKAPTQVDDDIPF